MGDTSGVLNRVLGHTIVPDLAAEISGSCSMFVEIANLTTKPSSCNDSLMARLDISSAPYSRKRG